MFRSNQWAKLLKENYLYSDLGANLMQLIYSKDLNKLTAARDFQKIKAIKEYNLSSFARAIHNTSSYKKQILMITNEKENIKISIYKVDNCTTDSTRRTSTLIVVSSSGTAICH